ncbi:uncharacterized protein LOC132624898 isoform X2 [Lycium barbarum]|uniref:uncharacterized protein LOC132624898 isoform X2 n=1 Tax=Lycium barbarum TaxID=112863 RepID=UPI00293ED7B0|nr:uncharacterized protein LOC132624898 isoform X2 [Lycium barbarum]XP_060195627.1 uncharacterized protein LOC132624898 isoform X2 [Lycium barbarum]
MLKCFRSRRVIRPWLGLKMLDLNDIVVAQLQERDPSFPKVNKGVLVSMTLKRREVVPSIASGDQVCDPICADFPTAPIKSKIQIRVMAFNLIWFEMANIDAATGYVGTTCSLA